ncbi:hypothetical protein PUN28_003659 [Cardiocondyla obscurior]|uniref:Uncharacterized protein n=1 Tax=Cardiocondyla obscurior TaxID=286306 RepID=A0AAW2GNK2_9HYME
MNFMSHVADEVRTSCRSPSVLSGSHLPVEVVEQPANAVDNERTAMPASQQGAYRHAGSAFEKCRRHKVVSSRPSLADDRTIHFAVSTNAAEEGEVSAPEDATEVQPDV